MIGWAGALPTRYTEEELENAVHAEDYVKVFVTFQKHTAVIDRITLWGLKNRRHRRFGQHLLLFHADYNPKPAYVRVVKTTAEPTATYRF